MFQIDESKLHDAIVSEAADRLIDSDTDLTGLVQKEVTRRVDQIFADTARAKIDDAISASVSDGFNREYQRIDSWGNASGAPTSIKKELDKIIGGNALPFRQARACQLLQARPNWLCYRRKDS